ncbi:MAG: HDOD domain-containing protein [Bryobacteraceae bacterium]
MVAPSFLRNLPPLPAIATRLLRLLGNEDVSFLEVANLLRSDAALSAEVLRIVNSPLFATRRVDSILQALSLLGVERLNSLVMMLSLCKFLAPAANSAALRCCWHHNLACATLCNHLARQYGRSRDTAYTAGLLHDIGRLAFLVAEPERYNELLLTTEVGADELRAYERAMFGLDHCEAGWLLAESWGLPEEIRELALHHHDVQTGHDGPGAERRSMTSLVHVGCSIADMLGFQAAGASAPWDMAQLQPWMPSSAQLVWYPEELTCLVAERINALECAGCAVAA